MDTYNPGDQICLMGFSRGAYTARALAGMLHRVCFLRLCLIDIPPQQPFQVGLLPRHNEEQIRFAWQMFKKTGKGSWAAAEGFKRTFSRDVKITFVGVW